MADPEFFLGPDGKLHPITPKKTGGAAAMAAMALGAAMAASSTAGGGTAAQPDAGGGAGGGGRTSSEAAARSGNHEEALRFLGLTTVTKVGSAREPTCVPRTSGQVRQFLVRHPCVSMSRMSLTAGDDAGTAIAVTVAWIELPQAGQAAELETLTGDVEPLPGGVRSGAHRQSRMDGAVVVIAAATATSGQPSARTLDEVAGTAAQFPPPST
ncbi:hypothetical protein [Amycolatopsis sp. NPDC058986]|uniref:hypothetical protein n=1 Tax=unclassified Amycolatopsis TaxID=2618356 RepID=UPI00366D8F7D